MSVRPFLISPIPQHVIDNARHAVNSLRNDPNKASAQLALTTIVEMTRASLEYYFIRPVDEMKLNAFAANIVKMGVNAGVGVLNTFGKRLIGLLSKDQLLVLADLIESSMLELPDDILEKAREERASDQ